MERGRTTGSVGSQSPVPAGHHQLGCSNSRSQFHGGCGEMATTAAAHEVFLLAYRNASHHLSCSGLKAGIHIVKLAALQWRQQGQGSQTARRAAAKSNRQSGASCSGAAAANRANSNRLSGASCSGQREEKSPLALDQLAALFLSGQSRLCRLAGQPQPPQQQPPKHQDVLCASKPQNCKRIVVLGAPRVGKTSILRRYVRDGFVEEYRPTSEEFLRKLFRIRGETYQIDILDASGERSFPAKRRLSILTGDIFLLVFSLDDQDSFDEVCSLRKEILAAKTKLAKTCSNTRQAAGAAACVPPIVICANKVDLSPSERSISREDVLQALGEDCTYFETSAKDSTSLEKVFETLAKKGGLPTETGPSQHRKVSLRSYQGAVRRPVRDAGVQEPCGALYPLARRPSFTSDLRQVLGPAESMQRSARPRPLEKCQVQ